MPVLHLLAGPNGAGKSSYAEDVLIPATGLEFVNADRIASTLWPRDGRERHTQEQVTQAADLAARRRAEHLAAGTSFLAETVFSHPSKLTPLREATARGFSTSLHVLLVPEDLSVARVADRVTHGDRGGHGVPEERIRARHRRLWALIAVAVPIVDDVTMLDNARARTPFRVCARFRSGAPVGEAAWPAWAPAELRALTAAAPPPPPPPPPPSR